MTRLTSDDICKFLAQQQGSSGAAPIGKPQKHSGDKRTGEPGARGPLRRLLRSFASAVKQLAKVAFVGGLGAAVVAVAVRVHAEHCRVLVARSADQARALMQLDVEDMRQQQQQAVREAEAARERAAAELERAVQAARAELRAELEAKVAATESQEAAARAQVHEQLMATEQQLATTQAATQARLQELHAELSALKAEAARAEAVRLERAKGEVHCAATEAGPSDQILNASPAAAGTHQGGGKRIAKAAAAAKAQRPRRPQPGPCSSPFRGQHGLGTSATAGMETASAERSLGVHADARAHSE